MFLLSISGFPARWANPIYCRLLFFYTGCTTFRVTLLIVKTDLILPGVFQIYTHRRNFLTANKTIPTKPCRSPIGRYSEQLRINRQQSNTQHLFAVNISIDYSIINKHICVQFGRKNKQSNCRNSETRVSDHL